MKATNVIVRKTTVPVVKAVNEALMKVRKTLKVGAGELSEAAWYLACAEALTAALRHVQQNLPDPLEGVAKDGDNIGSGQF